MPKTRFRYKKKFRMKRKKSIFKSRFFWFAILLFIILAGFFYLFVFASFFQIKEIKITGTSKTSLQEIKSLVDAELNNKILFLNSKSIFLVDLKELSQKILSDFIWISAINIKKIIPDVLTIEVKERIPAGVWSQNQDYFYFDEKGVIFAKSEETMKPQVSSELPDFKVFLGKPALEEKYIVSILEINKTLTEDMKLEIKEFIVSGDGKNLKLEMAEGWRIFFDSGEKEKVYDEIVNLSSVLKEKIPPEKRKNLDYIDLRFGNRVFYKQKD